MYWLLYWPKFKKNMWVNFMHGIVELLLSTLCSEKTPTFVFLHNS